jgi:hypothetical protein
MLAAAHVNRALLFSKCCGAMSTSIHPMVLWKFYILFLSEIIGHWCFCDWIHLMSDSDSESNTL